MPNRMKIDHQINGQALGVAAQDGVTTRVGSYIRIQVSTDTDTYAGFAVGGESVSLAEWNDTGLFDFHVPPNYENQSMRIVVAVRARDSKGISTHAWLGPVDEAQELTYRVVADPEAASEPCP